MTNEVTKLRVGDVICWNTSLQKIHYKVLGIHTPTTDADLIVDLEDISPESFDFGHKYRKFPVYFSHISLIKSAKRKVFL